VTNSPDAETIGTSARSTPSEATRVATQATLTEAYDATQDSRAAAPYVGDVASWCVQVVTGIDGTSGGHITADAPEDDC
jgi:hypothetical protein